MFDYCVIGGGFYGCMIALHLAKKGSKVALYEQESDLMTKASYNNQAVIHKGYHYPRAQETRLSSEKNYTRFKKDFPNCFIDTDKYYAFIGNKGSAFVDYEVYFSKLKTIEDESDYDRQTYKVVEDSFNVLNLKQEIKDRLKKHKVKVYLNSTPKELDNKLAKQYIIATYSAINQTLANYGLRPIELKHNITEMCLVNVPLWDKNKGLTVMDGPYFSLTPFPAEDCHVLTHVTEGVHATWHSSCPVKIDLKTITSRFNEMYKKVKQLYPSLIVNHLKSYYEIKTFIPGVTGDARPILVKEVSSNITVVVGSKIDNIYDVLDWFDTKNYKNKNIIVK